jgi:ABC-type phosphate transport system substrate-binding protein
MKKTPAALAWAAIPVLLISISACNGNATGGSSGITPTTSTPAASQRGRVHHNDNGPGDIHAGGATFPGYGYNLGVNPVGAYTQSQAGPGQGSLFYNAQAKIGDGNTIYYCLVGSGTGKNEFDGDVTLGTVACPSTGSTGFGGRTDPIDFAGSDVALASNECCASGSFYYADGYYGTGSGKYGTAPIEIPTYGGPIVFPYLNEGGSGLTGLGSNQLKLSTWTYCAISNGTIGYWDDAAINADNGGTAVTSHQPITFYYRSGTSGTTYLFETKLNDGKAGCNQNFKGKYTKSPYAGIGRSAAWTAGVPSPSDAVWTGPTGSQTSGSDFLSASGNPGIIAGIQSGTGSPYATGYAEGAWAAAATSPAIAQAAVLSGTTFVSPTNANAVAEALAKATAGKIAYGGGSDGNPLNSTNTGCELYIPPTAFDDPPSGAYPIVGLSYFLFYNQNQTRDGSNHYADLANLIQYLDSNAWNNILPTLEYTPLPASTQKKVQQAVFGKGAHHTGACFAQ